MFNLDGLTADFDEQYRIVHLTAREQIKCKTLDDGFVLARKLKEILARYFSHARGYLITDYSKIVIEPKHIDEYAAVIKDIMDKYLYPDGIARYGFEITRVTAQLGHELYLGTSPNLFNSYEEALAYIKKLARDNIAATDSSTLPTVIDDNHTESKLAPPDEPADGHTENAPASPAEPEEGKRRPRQTHR